MTRDWTRVPTPELLIQQFGPSARVWRRDVDDGVLTAMRTMEQHEDGGPWLCHISISHSPLSMLLLRYPTWEEQKEAVWRFVPGKWMVSYLPPQNHPGYINIHETTFHWWESTEGAP